MECKTCKYVEDVDNCKHLGHCFEGGLYEQIEAPRSPTSFGLLERLVMWLRGEKNEIKAKVESPDLMLLGVGREVMVYDRYRFAIPLPGVIVKLSDCNDGVGVELRKSNSGFYPIGETVWVHMAQLKPAI